MTTTPITLGVLVSGHRPAKDAVAVAEAAEAAGIAEVWVSEDYFERGAFAVAGAIAQATDRVAIGLGVVNPWTRHPLLTAMEVAALDEVAEGRVILGLGSSNPTWMHDRMGIDFQRPLTVLTETVAVLRQALQGEAVSQNTTQHRMDAQLSFRPLRADVPIVLGVKNEQAIQEAGRISDGLLLTVLSPPPYVQWVRDRAGGALLRGYVALACDADRDRALQHLRPFTATFLGVHGDHPVTRLGGLGRGLARQLRQAWLDGRPAGELVTDDIIAAFTVVGTEAECRTGLQAYAEAGLDVAIVRDDGRAAPDEVGDLLRRMATASER